MISENKDLAHEYILRNLTLLDKLNNFTCNIISYLILNLKYNLI